MRSGLNVFLFGVRVEAGTIYGVGRKDIIKTIHFVEGKKSVPPSQQALISLFLPYLESSLEMSFR